MADKAGLLLPVPHPRPEPGLGRKAQHPSRCVCSSTKHFLLRVQILPQLPEPCPTTPTGRGARDKQQETDNHESEELPPALRSNPDAHPAPPPIAKAMQVKRPGSTFLHDQISATKLQGARPETQHQEIQDPTPLPSANLFAQGHAVALGPQCDFNLHTSHQAPHLA